MALHATDPYVDFRVRNTVDVLVTFGAKPFAVHAVFKFLFHHVQRAHLPVWTRHRESLRSVTAQALFVTRPLRPLARRLGCRFPGSCRCNKIKKTSHNAGGKPRPACGLHNFCIEQGIPAMRGSNANFFPFVHVFFLSAMRVQRSSSNDTNKLLDLTTRYHVQAVRHTGCDRSMTREVDNSGLSAKNNFKQPLRMHNTARCHLTCIKVLRLLPFKLNPNRNRFVSFCGLPRGCGCS